MPISLFLSTSSLSSGNLRKSAERKKIFGETTPLPSLSLLPARFENYSFFGGFKEFIKGPGRRINVAKRAKSHKTTQKVWHNEG